MGKFAIQPGICGQKGFTLVEMLAVMAIMATMMAMVIPSFGDALAGRSRKAAVNMLLNSFEQARITALEQSTNVYVGFADQNFPQSGTGQGNEGFPYRRFIIFRDSNPDTDGPSAPRYVAMTKWLKLPDGISFKSGSATIADGAAGATLALAAADRFPSVAGSYDIPVLKFNSTGAIETPAAGNMWLFIYEGFFGGSTDVFTRAAGNTSGLFERISFARYTGRAQLDITSLAGA